MLGRFTPLVLGQWISIRALLLSSGVRRSQAEVGAAVRVTQPRRTRSHPAAGLRLTMDREDQPVTEQSPEPEPEREPQPGDGGDARSCAGKRKSEENSGGVQEKPPRGKRRRGGGGKQLRPGERYVPPPQKRNPAVSFTPEHFAETSYYFEAGLRKVRPYYFDFKTYCKGRWIGKTLLQVFSTEFRAEPLDYYRKAAKEGRIRLNEEPVEDLNIRLKNNDFLRNTVHRHEPPVVGRPLEILVDDGEVVVVDKPASLPVHPCGRYRHNTVIFILGKERGLHALHTVHRLDRLTSGVLLFARTLEVSKKLDQMVRDRQLEKEYVCRVDGEFPDGEVVCEEPILVVSFKVGVCRVDPKGKDCRTVFQKLSYNGRSSVVRCRPLTGRTHQIRVHLQFLGFPILNDPIYGASAWGPNRGKGGVVGMNDDELLEALISEHRSKESLGLLDLPDDGEDVSVKGGAAAGTAAGGDDGDGLVNDGLSVSTESGNSELTEGLSVSSKLSVAESSQAGNSDLNTLNSEPSESSGLTEETANGAKTKKSSSDHEESSKTADSAVAVRDHLCAECKIVRADPTEEELVMYLHALCYKGPDFKYSTQLPDWAKEDWVQD
ncbi:RNA pseudouridylate synthase domain-containing protein 2 [Astyanax mexicanus]|uniref:Pseudouridylate synthase RPUSD2 n=1 Tax=Astyanax mexicanus TaxID=7994 RepID=A0A8B9KMS2_ASTMX|nr:RNA pseudouridylate synthase domain-containing protein 2 [Astyanax mexicanus]